MTTLIDPFILPLFLASPLLGALFVWVMPATDRLTLRHMGLFTALFSVGLSLRAGKLLSLKNDVVTIASSHVAFFEWPLQLELQTLPWLLTSNIVFAICIRAGAARITLRMKSYVALMLLTQACVNGAFLAQSPIAAWALMSLSTFPIAYIFGVFGGSHRGESTLSFVVIHGSFDALSLVALTWLLARSDATGGKTLVETAQNLDGTTALWVFAGLSTGAFARLFWVPLSSWSRGVCDNAPLSVASLVFCISPLVGASFLLRFAFAIPQAVLVLFPFLAAAAAFSAFLGGLGTLIDKDMRRFGLGLTRFFCAVSTLGFLTLDETMLWYSQALLCISVVSICGFWVVLDSIDRRYVTYDSVELVGMRTQLPGLWRLLFAAILSALGVPIFGAGLFILRLIPQLGVGDVAFIAGLSRNAGLLLTPIVLLAWLFLFVAGARHLRRTGSFPIGTSLATPSELNRGQALRLWIPLVTSALLGILLLKAEHLLIPHWGTHIEALKKNVARTPAIQKWSPKKTGGLS